MMIKSTIIRTSTIATYIFSHHIYLILMIINLTAQNTTHLNKHSSMRYFYETSQQDIIICQ